MAFRVALDILDAESENAERDLRLLMLLDRRAGNVKLESKGIGGGGKAGMVRDRDEEDAPVKEGDEENVETVTGDKN